MDKKITIDETVEAKPIFLEKTRETLKKHKTKLMFTLGCATGVAAVYILEALRDASEELENEESEETDEVEFDSIDTE